MRIARPWVTIRIFQVRSDSIGHFAGNTEIYLSERDLGIDVPSGRCVDWCYFTHAKVANTQLARMWKRRLNVGPSALLAPALELNRRLRGGAHFDAGGLIRHNRDIHHALERTRAHLAFTAEEESLGALGLRNLGLPEGSQFICLLGRDEAYLRAIHPDADFSYHHYRNVDIGNFVLVAEAFAEAGYYVVRMGSIVKEAIPSRHPKVIDYATSDCRSDFLDIYLGAKCFLCIGVGSGVDAIPMVFRRPIAYVSAAPIGYLHSFLAGSILLGKRHRDRADGHWLTLSEIFSRGAGHCLLSACYEAAGVEVVDNSPEEIRDAAMELLARFRGEWTPAGEDELLQAKFWSLYPLGTREPSEGLPLHSDARARYSAKYLRTNQWWLQ